MTTMEVVVHLSDLDLLIREAQDPGSRARLKKLGFGVEGLPRLGALRAKVAETMEKRWLIVYERTRLRYGRAVAAVRERVCSGCHVTLPTIARPRSGDSGVLHACESCARILYWA